MARQAALKSEVGKGEVGKGVGKGVGHLNYSPFNYSLCYFNGETEMFVILVDYDNILTQQRLRGLDFVVDKILRSIDPKELPTAQRS